MARSIPDLLGAVFGSRSATFYRLDPTGRVPRAVIGEVYGRFNNNKQTIGMIRSESGETRVDAVELPVEDFADITAGAIKKNEQRTITGLLSSSIPIPLLGGVGASAILSGLQQIFGVSTRPDLIQLANLRAMQARGEPIAVSTPRWSARRVLMTSIADSWAPGMGESIALTIQLREVRIASPLDAADLEPDLASLSGGDYSPQSAGPQALQPSDSTLSGGGPVAAPVVSGGA